MHKIINCERIFYMGFFGLFKKKKVQLTQAQLQWNKLWELWTRGEVESPYAELMTYQSEINNGGHVQYFSNMENTGDLQKEMAVLESTLPLGLIQNLQSAYKTYLESKEPDEDDDDGYDGAFAYFDDVYYENEDFITKRLEQRAEKVEL